MLERFVETGCLTFLSTLSVRRATVAGKPPSASTVFLSTLSVRRATERWSRKSIPYDISIHALREESDSGGAIASPLL